MTDTDFPISTEFVEANGLRFEVDMAGDENSDKLAICLHGFPENSFSWRYQMPVLAKLGYRVWAPNLRGYKNTSRPLGVKNYLIEHLIEDVRCLIEASGKKEVVLIAHDWGGAIAWTYVLREHGPVDKFIVMNLPHPQRMMEKLRGWKQFLRSWYIFFFQIPWLPEFMMKLGRGRALANAFVGMAVDKSKFPPEVVNEFVEPALKPGVLTAMINYYRGMIRGGGARDNADLQDKVIQTPTLMVWGEKDTALDITTTYDTDKLVDDFTLRYVPNVSHWVQQEAPEVVNAIVEAWLTGQPVPEAIEIDPSLADKG